MSEVNTINTYIAEALTDLIQDEESLRMLRDQLILPGTGIDGKYLRSSVADPIAVVDRMLEKGVQKIRSGGGADASERITQLFEKYFVKDGLLNEDTVRALEQVCKLEPVTSNLELTTRLGRSLVLAKNGSSEVPIYATPEEVSEYLLERAEVCTRTRGTGRKIVVPLYTTHTLESGVLAKGMRRWPKSQLIVSVDRDYFLPEESENIDIFIQQTARELIMNCRDQFAQKHEVEQVMEKVGSEYKITQQGGQHIVGFDPCTIFFMARRTNGMYEFVVADTGKGFTNENLSNIAAKVAYYRQLDDAGASAEEIMIEDLRKQMRPDVSVGKQGGSFGLPNIKVLVEDRFGGKVELGNNYEGARHNGDPLALPGAFVRILAPTKVLTNFYEAMAAGSDRKPKTQYVDLNNLDDEPAAITEWFD